MILRYCVVFFNENVLYKDKDVMGLESLRKIRDILDRVVL